MSYGMPGQYDIPGNIPVYGYGSYHGRASSSPRALLRRLFRSATTGEWSSFSLTYITIGIAIYSVEHAHWVSAQFPLLFMLLLAMVSTWILTRLTIPHKVKIIIAAGLLVLMVLWQASKLSGGRPLFQFLTANPNESTVYFGVFLLTVTWITGVYSIWSVLRRGNAWLPAAVGAGIILVNLSNLSADSFVVLPVYMAAALVLIGITRLNHERSKLALQGGRYPNRIATSFVFMVVTFSILAALVAWFIPARAIEQVGFDASGRLVNSVQKNWFNIFASVPSKWSTIRSEDLKSLLFNSPLDKRETVLFTVTSPYPAYWRIERYPEYGEDGWKNYSIDTSDIVDPGTAVATGLPENRREFTYTVETSSKTDAVLVVGEFVSADIPVKIETHSPITDDTTDVMSVITPRLLQPHEIYTVTASVSVATPEQLQNAGTDYPDWVTLRYLQVPADFPQRVQDLASRITETRSNAYDKASIVQQYLNMFRYNRDAKSPSKLGDETEVFLFQQKEGVCTDFATAMVMMLRSVGVPARLATGYVPGDHEQGTNTYVVRGRDYHAWPEVYFPGYGWINFEPTPGTIVDTDIPIGSGDDTSSYYDLYPPFPYDTGSGSIPGDLPAIPKTKGTNYTLPIIGGTLLALALGGIIWLFANRAYRNLRRSGDAVLVYGKMCRLASFGGAAPIDTETPIEYCHRLEAVFPSGAQAISDIAALYTKSRFSPRKDLAETELVRLQKSWVELYPIMFKRRLPWNK